MDRQSILEAYKEEKDPKIKERILMVKLYKFDGESSNKIGEKLGHSHAIVLKWTRRFESEGLEGLKDRPRSGRPPKTPKVKMEKIKEEVEKGDFWTSSRSEN
jgi:putative transposase